MTSPKYVRRIHIMGKPDNTVGYMLKVYDAETSEPIQGVCRTELILDAREISTAKITYYEHDEQGKLVLKDGEPVQEVVTVDNPSVSLTAYEVTEEEQDNEQRYESRSPYEHP